MLAFPPGGSETLLMGVSDGDAQLQVQLLRLTADGKALVQRNLPGRFTAAAWLDNERIVTGDDKGKIQGWNAASNAPPEELASLPEPVAGLSVSPLTHGIAVRSKNGPLRVLLPNGRPAGPAMSLGVPQPGGACGAPGLETAPVFSADERLIAFAGVCGELRVAGRDGTRLTRPDPPRPYVKRHAFSADGKTLLVGYGGPPGAELWAISPGRLAFPRPLTGHGEQVPLIDLAALPDSGFVVLTNDRLRFVASDGQPLSPDVAVANPGRLAVSADGRRLAIATRDGLQLLDRTGRRLQDRPFAEFGKPLAAAALVGGKTFVSLTADGILRFWRPDGTQALPPLAVWPPTAADAAAGERRARLLTSPNGRLLAIHAANGQFDVFDEAGKRVGRPLLFPTDGNGASRGAYVLLDDRVLRPAPDGSGFLIFAFDGRMLGRLALAAPAERGLVAAAVNGSMLATYNGDQVARLRSLDGKLLRERKIESRAAVGSAIELSGDGRTIVLRSAPPGGELELTIWRGDSLVGERASFERLLPDGRLARFTKGRFRLGDAALAIDADEMFAISDDASLALVGKAGAARTIAPSR